MAGGTLVVSREINNHSYYKKQLEAVGFLDVTSTVLEKDALNSLIRDLKPDLLMMDARFYQCCTPFLMGELKQRFPKLKMAAYCIGEYPAENAMYFVLNGINSYVTSFDGFEQFFKGLDEICKGREYISPAVVERIDKRKDYPMCAGKITERHIQVIRLICCGFKDLEIADTLHISRRTVDNHKTDIFTTLNVRNSNELIRAAITLGIVSQEEIYFYPKDFTVNPQPEKKKPNRRNV
jgi:DNA-binding NarL/FixJ family response regulator